MHRHRISILGFLAAVAIVGAGSILVASPRQDDAARMSQLFYIFIEHVNMGSMGAYEAATGELITALEDNDVKSVEFNCVMGPEIGYAYSMPLDGFAGMDERIEGWEAAVQRIGLDTWSDVAARADAAVERREAFFMMQRLDLSYLPAKMRLKPEEGTYLSYGFYSVRPGHEQAFEALARDFAAIYEKHDHRDPWVMFKAVTGPDLPLYVICHAARSAADFHTEIERFQSQMSEDEMALVVESMQHVRRYEHRDATVRPDLSYPRR